MRWIDDWMMTAGFIAVAIVGGLEGFLTGDQVTYLMLSGGGFAYGAVRAKKAGDK